MDEDADREHVDSPVVLAPVHELTPDDDHAKHSEALQDKEGLRARKHSYLVGREVLLVVAPLLESESVANEASRNGKSY